MEAVDVYKRQVYISSKESYAMQLFKVQPLDFLIKPVPVEQIKEVLIRSIKQKRSADTYFEYQKGNSVFRVPIKDIAYFMSMDKKIVIVKKDGEEEFYGKLRSIAENLPADFIMIHQSYIINQAFVCEYSYEAVKLSLIHIWDSLAVVLSGNRKEVGMDTLEVLTLLLVVFAALTYIDNKHNRK